MIRLSRLAAVLALVIASVPTADAQLGGLVNRARNAISGGGSAPSASSTTTVDFARFLSTPFTSGQGTFYFGGTPRVIRGRDHLVFPPSGINPYDEIGQYVVRRDGRVIGRQTATHAGTAGSDAFVVVETSGAPQWSALIEGGASYTLDLEIGGEIVGTFPFTAETLTSDDPFNPGSTTRLDGPWRTHAFFQHETDRPEYLMSFYAWLAPDEIETGKPTEISIQRDGEEVAWGRGFTDMTFGWGAVEYTLYKPEGRDDQFGRQVANAPRWGVQDVTSGPYEILFLDETGRVFRTMEVEGGAGSFVPHSRSTMGHQPRSTFLTPRRMIGRGSLFVPHSVYWIAP